LFVNDVFVVQTKECAYVKSGAFETYT